MLGTLKLCRSLFRFVFRAQERRTNTDYFYQAVVPDSEYLQVSSMANRDKFNRYRRSEKKSCSIWNRISSST
jgi:hypothetical protein